MFRWKCWNNIPSQPLISPKKGKNNIATEIQRKVWLMCARVMRKGPDKEVRPRLPLVEGVGKCGRCISMIVGILCHSSIPKSHPCHIRTWQGWEHLEKVDAERWAWSLGTTTEVCMEVEEGIITWNNHHSLGPNQPLPWHLSTTDSLMDLTVHHESLVSNQKYILDF